ncbi:MAG TPA: squalene/phytoene synthase family protein, partial [Bacteroidales bacterium]|nr:squalene/phytoene synthase family protein [Bacteroidales bacterium]
EIVDTFHDYDKEKLLKRFRRDTYRAIDEGISLNPILHSFQMTVNQYGIDNELTETFLDSMKMDIYKHRYDREGYKRYILGSAEVVGLMCLKVFLDGDEKEYQRLKPYAMGLGSAFQKINFLRDLHADVNNLERVYFPELNGGRFDEETKKAIENDIEADFRQGYEGIKLLPKSTRFGVWLAYVYFYALFRKIKKLQPETIMSERVRIPNRRKYRLLFTTYIRHSFNIL